MNINEPVWQIATTKIVSIAPDTSAELMEDFFKENKFHHAPVVDAAGNLQGIISSEDLLRISKLAQKWNKSSIFLTAKDVMTKYPIFLSPDDSIGTAIELFLENKFHALPILEDGVLVGMVTTHDILDYAMKMPLQETSED